MRVEPAFFKTTAWDIGSHSMRLNRSGGMMLKEVHDPEGTTFPRQSVGIGAMCYNDRALVP